MTALLPLMMFLVFMGCIGVLFTEGMWSNAIRLINVVTAALLATNFWEPVARSLDQWNPSYTYFWDYIAIWGLFFVFMAILRTITDRLSRVKMKFLTAVDRAGSALFAAWIGWVMVCFIMFTLHMAPLGRNFLFGGFKPEDAMIAGTAPDRLWLGFVQNMSQGPFARYTAEGEGEPQPHVFDPRAEFLMKYASRRAELESHVENKGAFRVDAR
jgi:hypothetical protein